MKDAEQIFQALKKEWQLADPDVISEQQILFLLEKRISELLQQNPEEFFQWMYRLDIPEQQLNYILHHSDHVSSDLAMVIYKRQLQKMISRQQWRSKDRTEDEDLAW